MRIGELARRAGVSPRALRYYEEQQLLPADRSASGQRQYPESAVDRVLVIQQLYAAGLSSRTILELLPCMHTGVATPAMRTRMAVERERIDQRIRQLTHARDRLDEVIVAAHRTGHPCAVAGASEASASVRQGRSDGAADGSSN